MRQPRILSARNRILPNQSAVCVGTDLRRSMVRPIAWNSSNTNGQRPSRILRQQSNLWQSDLNAGLLYAVTLQSNLNYCYYYAWVVPMLQRNGKLPPWSTTRSHHQQESTVEWFLICLSWIFTCAIVLSYNRFSIESAVYQSLSAQE